MVDITDLLTARSISISRWVSSSRVPQLNDYSKRLPTASDSDTESPKRPRQNMTTRAIPVIFPRQSRSGPLRIASTVATSHALPVGPGWKDGLNGERDGLDEIISGLKNGSIRNDEQLFAKTISAGDQYQLAVHDEAVDIDSHSLRSDHVRGDYDDEVGHDR